MKKIVPRRIITFKYLQDSFGKKGIVWEEIVFAFALDYDECLTHFQFRAEQFLDAGGPKDGNPWHEFAIGVTKLSKTEYKMINRDAMKFLADRPKFFMKLIKRLQPHWFK